MYIRQIYNSRNLIVRLDGKYKLNFRWFGRSDIEQLNKKGEQKLQQRKCLKNAKGGCINQNIYYI